MTDFPYRLRSLREKRGWRQKDVAEKLGISESAYGYYEQGRREPSNDTLRQLADIFNVKIDYLLGRTNDPQGAVNEQQEYDQNFLEFKEMWDSISEEDRQYLFNLVKNLVELKKESKGGK